MNSSDHDEKSVNSVFKYAAWLELTGRYWALFTAAILFAIVVVAGAIIYIHYDSQPGKEVHLWIFSYTKNDPINRIYARVEEVRGSVWLTASAAGGKRRIWSDSNLVVEIPSSYSDFGYAERWKAQSYAPGGCANRSTEWLGKCFYDSGAAAIDKAYSDAIMNWWGIVAPLLSSARDVKLSNAAVAELRSGETDELELLIRPVTSAAWSLTVVTVQISIDGHERLISQSTFNNDSPAARQPDGVFKFNVPIGVAR